MFRSLLAFDPFTGIRCQKIEGLDALVNLEELWLGKNKIAKLEVSDISALNRRPCLIVHRI